MKRAARKPASSTSPAPTGAIGSTRGHRGAETPHGPVLAEEAEARGLLRDQHVPRAEIGDRVERHHEVLLLEELLADEALGLPLVRGDEERLGVDSLAQGLALRIEHAVNPTARQRPDRLGIEVVFDVTRQRAGEDDERRDARQVVQLVEQHMELVRPHGGAPFVDLAQRPSRRIDDSSRRARCPS